MVNMVLIFVASSLLAMQLLVDAKLDVDCGSPSGKSAVLTYTGNAVAVIAFAAGKKQCRFVEDTATATFKLTMAYKKTAGVDCLLEQTAVSLPSYGTTIETRLLHELVEGGDDEKFVVECVFTPVKKDVQLKVNIQPKFNPPQFIFKTSGITAKSQFTIVLTDMNNIVHTKAVAESQIVKLRTRMISKSGEKGYQPLQCTAQSMDGKVKILVLSDGCGTGYPFMPDQGFSMTGGYGDSPHFRMFRIKKKEGVVFKCTFVVCPAVCNMNSCHLHKSRKRRSVHPEIFYGVKYNKLGLVSHEESVGVSSADVTIHHDEPVADQYREQPETRDIVESTELQGESKLYYNDFGLEGEKKNIFMKALATE